MGERSNTVSDLDEILGDTNIGLFKMAGGFDYVDEIALALNKRWRQTPNGTVVVSSLDIAWLLDGYARARQLSTEDPDE